MKIDYVPKGIVISGKHGEIKEIGHRINCMDGDCFFIPNHEISFSIADKIWTTGQEIK